MLEAKTHDKPNTNRAVAIIEAVYDIPSQSVWSLRRNRKVRYIRSICYHVLHDAFKMSGTEIGRLFGVSRSSVNTARRAIRAQLTVDKNLRSQIEKITSILTDKIFME